MSNWTHVSGLVRFDDWNRVFTGKTEITKSTIEKIFGKIRNFEDDYIEGTYYCPMGSEGSLRYILHNDSYAIKSDAVCTRYMVIVGDLRDYCSHNEIIKWFKDCIKKCKGVGFSVRDAVITSYDEWSKKPSTWCIQNDRYKEYLKELNEESKSKKTTSRKDSKSKKSK